MEMFIAVCVGIIAFPFFMLLLVTSCRLLQNLYYGIIYEYRCYKLKKKLEEENLK